MGNKLIFVLVAATSCILSTTGFESKLDEKTRHFCKSPSQCALVCKLFPQLCQTTSDATTTTESHSRKWATLTGEPTQLMGHRGEKVFMPEHTLGSYELAAIEGADYVEPDLTLTQDGHVVCFHDLTLKVGTNVASLPQFVDKMTNFTGVIDQDMPPITITEDWFIKDFTLAELQQLKVVQKNIGIRPQFFNDLFTIPTFEQYLQNVHHNAFRLKKAIGIIPELKHPAFHNQLFNSTPNFMENAVLSILSRWGYPLIKGTPGTCRSPQDDHAPIPCGSLVLQSYELSCLKYLSGLTTVDRMLLLDVQLPLLTYAGLQEVSRYASYYALDKELVYRGIQARLDFTGEDYDKNLIEDMGGFIPPQNVVREAHKAGLKVGIYTIYDSREPSGRGCSTGVENGDPENKEAELYYHFGMSVDGIFVENVEEARELRLAYQLGVIEAAD